MKTYKFNQEYRNIINFVIFKPSSDDIISRLNKLAYPCLHIKDNIYIIFNIKFSTLIYYFNKHKQYNFFYSYIKDDKIITEYYNNFILSEPNNKNIQEYEDIILYNEVFYNFNDKVIDNIMNYIKGTKNTYDEVLLASIKDNKLRKAIYNF